MNRTFFTDKNQIETETVANGFVLRKLNLKGITSVVHEIPLTNDFQQLQIHKTFTVQVLSL